MSLPIIWSPVSKDEFAELLQHIEVNFGLDAALKLLETTEKVLEGISEHPALPYFQQSSIYQKGSNY